MRYFIYAIILTTTFFSSSCRKETVRPGVKGHIYDKETLRPTQEVTLKFCFIYRSGGSIIIKKEIVSDSLGYFEILPYEEFKFFLPTLESNDLSLCIDCVVTIEKKGFTSDSIFLEERNYGYKNKYFMLDSLFFSGRKIE